MDIFNAGPFFEAIKRNINTNPHCIGKDVTVSYSRIDHERLETVRFVCDCGYEIYHIIDDDKIDSPFEYIKWLIANWKGDAILLKNGIRITLIGEDKAFKGIEND